MQHLIATVTHLAERGIGFRSITEAMDTTTAGGEFIFHIMGGNGGRVMKTFVVSLALGIAVTIPVRLHLRDLERFAAGRSRLVLTSPQSNVFGG
jgi:hypothetical protein